MKYSILIILLFHNLVITGQQISYIDNTGSLSYGSISISPLSKSILDKVNDWEYEDFSSFFFVKVGSSGTKMLGHYRLSDTSIIFTPRFLPDPTMTHYVHFNAAALSEWLRMPVHGTEKNVVAVNFKSINGDKTFVKSFYPDLKSVPGNLLRAYVYFSHPMSLENPYDHIILIDDQGQQVDMSFVEVSEGLWNEERTRLTLLFHPGRIKRGVGPNIKNGPVFQQGKTYIIKISDKWKDAYGSPLTGYEKNLYIDTAIRKRIDMRQWQIVTPQENTDGHLLVKTAHPLDYILTQRMMSVTDVDGNNVEGEWKPQPGSDGWIFIPSHRWVKGKYTLRADPRLEDICGNTLLSPFDSDAPEGQMTVPITILNFRIN